MALAINRGFGDSHRVELVWRPVIDMITLSGWQGYGFGQARYLELIAAYAAAHPTRVFGFWRCPQYEPEFAMSAGWIGAPAL